MTTSFIVSFSLSLSLSLSFSLSFFLLFHTDMHRQQLRRTFYTGCNTGTQWYTHMIVINIIYTGWLWLRALKNPRNCWRRSFLTGYIAAVVTCTSHSWCVVLTASYTTMIIAIHNNEKQRIICTSRHIFCTLQLNVVGKGQVGINTPNCTTTAQRCSPCISGSNTFCIIIIIMGSTCSIPNPHVSQPFPTAQKRKIKQSKRSCVSSTVQTHASIWSIRTMMLRHFRGCYSVRCIFFNRTYGNLPTLRATAYGVSFFTWTVSGPFSQVPQWSL